jgi:hypothetical protein
VLSGALVFGGIVSVEVSHVLFQRLVWAEAIQLWAQLLPMSFLGTAAGTALSIVFLSIIVSAPLIGIAWLLGRCVIHWARTCARKVIPAIIVADVCFVVGMTLIGLYRLGGSITPELGPGFSIATTAVILLIRCLFVAAPLLHLLRVHRNRLDAVPA